jgi:hypothetical protein
VDDAPEPSAAAPAGEVRDALPEDLDRGFVGPYTFPDNKRRRIPGALYVVVGLGAIGLWLAFGDGGILVDDGYLVVGIALVLFGAYQIAAGYPLGADENDALVAATREVGFAVGHASAQLGWRGLRSRPTWRMLLYSAEDPPAQRALVLVDGVDGSVVDSLVEDNPEDWSE